MEEINAISQIISTVGFPIAMCIALLWHIKTLNETRKNETEKFTDALNRNTLMLQKLCDKMDLKCSVNHDDITM